MRVLIVGGDGMLGHQLRETLAATHEVRTTVRQDRSAYAGHGPAFAADHAYAGVDVRRADAVMEVLADFRPQAVVNAAGIVKQRPLAKEAIPSLQINALFPHQLALMCRTLDARLIHVSTDCVFSGRKGGYVESDRPDPEDLYGMSKLLGEVGEAGCLTLRTSMIGLELARKTSLVEWFLAQEGPIKGYRRAIFSGLTTAELSRLIDRLLTRHPALSGVWHVAARPISKHDLLVTLAAKLGRDLRIEPDDAYVCDRSLCGTAFEEATGYHAPSWDDMLDELARQCAQDKDQA